MRRPVLATTFRKNEAIRVRTYARIDTAVRRAAQLAVLEGLPGDTVEFADDRTGVQLGTIKVRVGGVIVVTWTIHRNALYGV